VAQLDRSAKKNSAASNFQLHTKMRKAISILFFVLFLFSLPGLVAGFKNAPDTSVLIGQAIFSLIMLILGIYFWKPAPPKKE
jgi:uncharacterized membrane protein YfcA